MSIENPTLAHFRHFSSLFTNLRAYKAPSTLVENPLQIDLFMQNKPNSPNIQIPLTSFIIMIYTIFISLTKVKNKPNSNPIKPNCRKGEIDAKSLFTKDYRKNDDFLVRINKPNFFKGPK